MMIPHTRLLIQRVLTWKVWKVRQNRHGGKVWSGRDEMWGRFPGGSKQLIRTYRRYSTYETTCFSHSFAATLASLQLWHKSSLLSTTHIHSSTGSVHYSAVAYILITLYTDSALLLYTPV